MVELLLLAILITVIVLSLRGGKSAVLDNPLVIRRPGQYHITLAPQLARAQSFIEQIAAQFALASPPRGDLPTRYFEVHERDRSGHGGGVYLLAAAYRGGLLYFQAIDPLPLLRDADSHLKQLREFSDAVLALQPLGHVAGEAEADKLRSAVETAAQQFEVSVTMLQDTES